MRRTCNPEKPVRIWHGAPLDFLRASEPVSCWPHKPCEWRSTRQPATRFWATNPERFLRDSLPEPLLYPLNSTLEVYIEVGNTQRERAEVLLLIAQGIPL